MYYTKEKGINVPRVVKRKPGKKDKEAKRKTGPAMFCCSFLP